VPDETTLCRFRNELGRCGLTGRLLAAVDAQLAARGLVLKRGTLIDASLVEADADVRKGPDGRPVTVEREAGFAKRRGKAFFGFKAHLAVDEGSGLVRRSMPTRPTTAPHDGRISPSAASSTGSCGAATRAGR
jgi:IS5 family transposase